MTQTAEPIATQEATEQIVRILNSKYEKTDLDQVAAGAEELDEHQQKKLLSLLKDFEDLFDGTLGKWNTDPIDIETKPDHKPSSARYYPVPKINKATFKKELEHLVEIGVLTPVQQSEYGTPVLSYQRKKVLFGSLLTIGESIKELFASHIRYQGLAKHCSKWKDSNMQLHLT
jgi:hypothetical protein